MLLSACVLSPGDADHVRHIAATLGNLPDELIFICNDPPSPAFLSAAKKFGARTVSLPWQNDFAAARNAGLDAANGEWVFWIDTDQTLLSPSRDEFRALLNRPDILGYEVTIQDIHEDSSPLSEHHFPALYRRRPELRYIGRVHEHFQTPLPVVAKKLGLTVALSPIRLSHTGYQTAGRDAKLRRNIPLLELELRDRPGQLSYLIELGRSLLLAGEPRGHAVMADAARALLPSLAAPNPPIPLTAALLEYAIRHAPADFPIPPAQAADAAVRWFPTTPPLLWTIARVHYQHGRIAEAAALLAQLQDMARTGHFDRSLSFDSRIFGDECRLNLGVCYAQLSEREKALQQFRSILRESPYFAAANANIQRMSSAES